MSTTSGHHLRSRATVGLRLTASTNGSLIAENFVHGGRTGETAGVLSNSLFQGLVSSCGSQAVTMTKTASVASTTPGGTVTYTITARNDGTSAVTGAALTDSLADVIDDATLQPGATADLGTVSVVSPNLNWTGDLAVGATATITYSVVVKTARTGNGRLVNGISSATPGSTCPSSTAAPGCRTTVTVSGLSIAKVADVEGAAGWTGPLHGDRHQRGGDPLHRRNFTDSLSDVVDDASYQADAVATVGWVSYAAPDLTWTGDLAVGENLHDHVLSDRQYPSHRERPADQHDLASTTRATAARRTGTDPACTTNRHRAPADRDESAERRHHRAGQGVDLRYTVTVTNSGQTPYTGATFTDSLTGVLDDGTFAGGATANTGTVTFSPNLTWTGDLAVGRAPTVTSVLVRNPDSGDRLLINAITSATPGSDCPAGNTNPACTTTVTVLVPGLTIVKSSDVAGAAPGGVVHYTSTITNSGQSPYTGIVVRDSLRGCSTTPSTTPTPPPRTGNR